MAELVAQLTIGTPQMALLGGGVPGAGLFALAYTSWSSQLRQYQCSGH